MTNIFLNDNTHTPSKLICLSSNLCLSSFVYDRLIVSAIENLHMIQQICEVDWNYPDFDFSSENFSSHQLQ